MSNREPILVVKREHLFADKYFSGYLPVDEYDYYKRIVDGYNWRDRNKIEKDKKYQQPIGYSVIVSPKNRSVFVFRRSTKDTNYKEKRLQGQWSWGVGGHIDKIDGRGSGDPITNSIKREIEEEVEIKRKFNPEIVGYINDDSDSVGKVHFGIVNLIKIEDENEVKINSAEFDKSKLVKIKDLKKIIKQGKIENWSKIIAKPIISYLQK